MTPVTEKQEQHDDAVARERAGTHVALWILASRFFGFFRETLTAAVFGVSAAGGALTFAFTIPNLFRRLFGEGALTAVFLPVYTRTADQGGKKEAQRLVSAVSGMLLGFLSLVSVVAILICAFAPRSWFGSSLGSTEQTALTLDYLMVLAPYLVFVCAYAMAMAVLNAHGRFLVSAAAPAVQNLIAIVGLLVATWMHFRGAGAGFLIAWFFLFSGIVQLAMQLPELARIEMLVAPKLELNHPAVKPILREMAPLVLGLGLVQINLLVDQWIAVSFLGEGGNQYISMGSRLLQLPIGIIGVSAATVSFPVFARLFAAGQLNTLRFELDRAVQSVAFLSIPAAAGMAALALPITQLLFEHGEFTPENTAQTAPVVAMYAAAIPALCVLPLVARIFYAASDTRTPVRLASGLVFLNLLLSLILVRPLGAAGIALATTLVSWVNLLGLVRLLREHALPKSQGLLFALFRMLLCALLCSGTAVLIQGWTRGAGLLISLFLGIMAGAVSYFLCAYFLRLEELGRLLKTLQRKKPSGA